MEKILQKKNQKNLEFSEENELIKAVREIRYFDEDRLIVNRIDEENVSGGNGKIEVAVEASYNNISITESPVANRDIVVRVSTTQGGGLKEKCMRAALDLVCVVDTSGSMIGFNPDGSRGTDGKIDRVKKTMSRMLDFLGDSDRFCLIVFTSKAKRVTPLINCTEQGKGIIRKHLEAIEAGGSTNIFEGLLQGLSVLDSRRDKNQVSSIFLLSDGCDKLSQQLLVKTFSTSAQYDAFSDISVNTFGFGEDDCNLMELIADRSGGVFYNVEEYSDCLECFVECLGSLLSILAEKAVLEVELLPHKAFQELHLTQIYSDAKKISDIKLSLDFKFLISGMNKHVVFGVQLPFSAQTKEFVEQSLPLLKATLTFCDLGTKQSHTLPPTVLNLMLTAGDKGKENESVHRQVLRTEMVNFQKNQITLVEKGNLEEAKKQEKLFELKYANNMANMKTNTLVANCYAQFNQTQAYVNNANTWNPWQLESEKRKIVSQAFSMKNECSNRSNRRYRNRMQRNMLRNCMEAKECEEDCFNDDCDEE